MNVNEIFAKSAINAFEKLQKRAVAKNRKIFFKGIVPALISYPLGILLISLALAPNSIQKMLSMQIILTKWVISKVICLPLVITDLPKYVAIESTFLNDIHKLMIGEDIKIMLWNDIINYDEIKYEKWLNEAIR
jgi:hypothetical protein